ncbi:butyrophilin-like protein 1 isoform X2 [Salvelinus fontinalis]|uniref:butyrophilin-like protein 1 isoform X2 n=1 Tax=Salvelinus fontinalis TaxID=8038 RepID=UPI002485FA7D|nr:butyrophilin-like protein 1 isoform X2 [Salvelinus fontinalis]
MKLTRSHWCPQFLHEGGLRDRRNLIGPVCSVYSDVVHHTELTSLFYTIASGSEYLQHETQEDKLKREASAGELDQFKLTSEDYVRADVGEEVTLPCHLSPDTSAVAMTIKWFKETECIYLYKNGQVTERSGYEGRLSLVTQELERGTCL